MSNNYFRFKQFAVSQEKAAMKVGTDGMLIGCWAKTDNCKRILDVGTGTGLLALMLAQRSEAEISAVEIEEQAASEAADNVKASPWAERIQVHHISFQEFAKEQTGAFDLIVSNPPYFKNSLKTNCKIKDLARHTDSLMFHELIAGAVNLLNVQGRLEVILPMETSSEFEKLAGDQGLILLRRTWVWPKRGKKVNRVLLSFGQQKIPVLEDHLFIYEANGMHSAGFKKLTRDFYLKF